MPNLVEGDLRTPFPQAVVDNLVQIFRKHSTRGIIPTQMKKL